MPNKNPADHAVVAAGLVVAGLFGVNYVWRIPTGVDARGFTVTTGGVLHYLSESPVSVLVATGAAFLAIWLWLNSQSES